MINIPRKPETGPRGEKEFFEDNFKEKENKETNLIFKTKCDDYNDNYKADDDDDDDDDNF